MPMIESFKYFYLVLVSFTASLRIRKERGPNFVPWGVPHMRKRRPKVSFPLKPERLEAVRKKDSEP